MKILLVSDTHQITRDLEVILEKHANEVNMVCHMGDHADDLLKFQSRYPQTQMVAVAGNSDYDPNLQREILLSFSGCIDANSDEVVRALIVHGDKFNVKIRLDKLAYYAKEKGAAAVFFGHSHFPKWDEIDGITLINPGSPTFPRGGSKASYGLVEILPDGKIKGELVRYV